MKRFLLAIVLAALGPLGLAAASAPSAAASVVPARAMPAGEPVWEAMRTASLATAQPHPDR
jgi:hypothetical protein